MSDCTKCSIEFPPAFCDALKASHFSAKLYEVPAYAETNIISTDQSYVVKVCIELDAKIKTLLCTKWCVSVHVESVGKGPEFDKNVVIDADHCDPSPDCVEIEIKGSEFHTEGGDGHCGHVSYIAVTVLGLDRCTGKPIGIAGFCRLGPVMVYP